MRYGMVIKARDCVGCEACSMVCKARHGIPPGIWYSRLLEKETGRYPFVSRSYVPLLCFHCKNPPCLTACPTSAISKRSDGIVLVDESRCCGVRMCIEACPYNALQFYHQGPGIFGTDLTPYERATTKQHRPNTTQKCNLCVDLIEQGKVPACVEVCSTQCRVFGDLDDPSTEVAHLVRSGQARQLAPELGTDPSVYYVF